MGSLMQLPMRWPMSLHMYLPTTAKPAPCLLEDPDNQWQQHWMQAHVFLLGGRLVVRPHLSWQIHIEVQPHRVTLEHNHATSMRLLYPCHVWSAMRLTVDIATKLLNVL